MPFSVTQTDQNSVHIIIEPKVYPDPVVTNQVATVTIITPQAIFYTLTANGPQVGFNPTPQGKSVTLTPSDASTTLFKLSPIDFIKAFG